MKQESTQVLIGRLRTAIKSGTKKRQSELFEKLATAYCELEIKLINNCRHDRNQRQLNIAQNQCVDCGLIIGEEPKTKEEWDQALRDEVEGLCWGDRV